MSDTLDYIQTYGDFSFEDLPFNEVDNAVLCEIFYMALEKVAPQTFTEEPKSFADVAKDMFSFNGNKHVGPGLVLTKKISRKMMVAGSTKRYGTMMVTGAVEVYKERPAVQFGAVTYLLSTGEKVIVFRGTDDTLVGWLEDVNIYTKHSIPSHQLAVDYIAQVAETFPDGELIICGHSKGGNVALYGALASSKAVRDRIKYVFNNEGPGFDTYAWYSTPAYKELLPKYRHFVPTSSFIGMLLAHDKDYEVIKNKAIMGMLQHDLSNWKTKEITLSRAKDLNILGKITDKFLNKFIMGVDDAKSDAFDKVCEAIMLDGLASSARGLADLPKNLGGVIKGAKKSWGDIADEDKETFKSCFDGTVENAKSSVNETVDEYREVREARKAAKNEAKPEPAMA